MTTAYARQQASALATLRRKGTAITFTQQVRGTHDAATGTYTSPSTVTVAGYAMRVPGDPATYKARELIQSEAPALLFAPTTAGSLPALGATCGWNGVTYTVRDVDPFAPDGPAILATILVSR